MTSRHFESFILTSTPEGNRYLYDREKKSLLLCNHLFYYILQLARDGRNVEAWFDSFTTDPIEIEDLGSFTKKGAAPPTQEGPGSSNPDNHDEKDCCFSTLPQDISKQEVEYYIQKYLFLKKHGYFSEAPEESDRFEGINAETVKYAIANSRQVTFEVTESCNLNCKYCGYGRFYEKQDGRIGADLDKDAAKRILTYLSEYWNSTLNISHGKEIYVSFYGGEPLLKIDFIKEIVDFIKKQKLLHNHIVLNMTTNALLLEKHMDFLVESDFKLLISLDGDERNNGYRVYKNDKPAYAQILRNIKALQQKYPAYFKKNVNFNAVLHNLNSVDEINDFFKKNFDKLPRIGELNNIGVIKSEQINFWKMYTSFNESLYKAHENLTGLGKDIIANLPSLKNITIFLLKYSNFMFEDYRHLFSPAAYKKKIPTGTCLPFSKKIFVTAAGWLLPCENVPHRFRLGSVSKDRVDLNFDEIAERYNSYFTKIGRQCRSCYVSESCQSCMFTMNFVDEMPVCDHAADKAKFSKQLMYYLLHLEWDPEIYRIIMEKMTLDF